MTDRAAGGDRGDMDTALRRRALAAAILALAAALVFLLARMGLHALAAHVWIAATTHFHNIRLG